MAREIWSAVAEGEARRHRFSRQTLLLLVTQPDSTSAFVGQPDLGVDRQNGEKRCRRTSPTLVGAPQPPHAITCGPTPLTAGLGFNRVSNQFKRRLE